MAIWGKLECSGVSTGSPRKTSYFKCEMELSGYLSLRSLKTSLQFWGQDPLLSSNSIHVCLHSRFLV